MASRTDRTRVDASNQARLLLPLSGAVVLFGTAEIDESEPSAAENTAWIAKYATEWERSGTTPESFAQRFSVPVRIRILALHGR